MAGFTRMEGVLVQGDPVTIEHLRFLNRQGEYRQFILKEHSDTCLLCKDDAQERLQPLIDALIKKNSFTPPLLEMQQEGKSGK